MIDHILPSLLQWLHQSSVHWSNQLQLLSQWSGHLHSSQLLGTESTTIPPLVEGQVRPSVLMIQPPQLLSSLVSLMNNHTYTVSVEVTSDSTTAYPGVSEEMIVRLGKLET